VESIEDDDNLTVVVFTSRNPEFFLAHYDTERDPAKTDTERDARADRNAALA
jgi:enoyl-CoA hydratase/carnithine racemase